MDAVKAAVEGRVFECPVPLDATLPMIHVSLASARLRVPFDACFGEKIKKIVHWLLLLQVSDLVEALLKLQSAPRRQLRAPEAGYCIRGFSFSPRDLFRILKVRMLRLHLEGGKIHARLFPHQRKIIPHISAHPLMLPIALFLH